LAVRLSILAAMSRRYRQGTAMIAVSTIEVRRSCENMIVVVGVGVCIGGLLEYSVPR
jgi:hypothetical protein